MSPFASIAAWDDAVMRWLHGFVFASPTFDRFVAWVLGEPLVKFGPLLLAVCALWFQARPDRLAVRAKLVDAIVAGLLGLFVGRLAALGLPYRERPVARPDLDYATPLEVAVRTWSSMPSDHAVMAFALAVSLARISPRVGAWALFHAVVFVCLPRLYFGWHFPTDLLAGALLGALLVALVAWAPPLRALGRGVLACETRRPALFHAAGFVLLYEIMQMFQSLRHFAAGVFRVLRHQLG